MDDEIEAFMSVYAEDACLDSLPLEAFQHNVAVTVRQRGALDTATCFVEARVHIFLPASYPERQFPTVSVQRVCGMNDEGEAFRSAIAEFFKTQVEVGDDVLFPLMEAMLDFLDEANDGECLICLSSLLVNPGCETAASSTNIKPNKKPIALRTTCLHCFHVQCLTRWGAIYLSNEYLKAADKEGTLDERSSRALRVLCVQSNIVSFLQT
jgi:hypothetical protein